MLPYITLSYSMTSTSFVGEGVINMYWISKHGLVHLSLMYKPLHWGLHGN